MGSEGKHEHLLILMIMWGRDHMYERTHKSMQIPFKTHILWTIHQLNIQMLEEVIIKAVAWSLDVERIDTAIYHIRPIRSRGSDKVNCAART